MMICDQLIVIILFVGGVHTLHEAGKPASKYNYDPRGAAGVFQWRQNYITCDGERQSPVDIRTANLRYRQLQCPSVQYETRVQTGKFENTGLFAKFSPRVTGSVRMTNVPFSNGNSYVFKNLHAHHGGVLNRGDSRRGPNSSILYSGAEHLVDGHRFDGEVHMVFYNSQFKDIKEASQYQNGLAVVAVFIEVVPDRELTDQRFSMFLEDNLPKVTTLKSHTTSQLDIGMFLDRECSFYTYDGSLTTPHCNESVQWIVLRKSMQVGKSAWVNYGALESHGNHNEVFGNYRNTMPLNRRVVTANFIPGNPQSYMTHSLLQSQPLTTSRQLARSQTPTITAAARMATRAPAYLAPFGFARPQTHLMVAPNAQPPLNSARQNSLRKNTLKSSQSQIPSSTRNQQNRFPSKRQNEQPMSNSFAQRNKPTQKSRSRIQPLDTHSLAQNRALKQNSEAKSQQLRHNSLAKNHHPAFAQTKPPRLNPLEQNILTKQNTLAPNRPRRLNSLAHNRVPKQNSLTQNRPPFLNTLTNSGQPKPKMLAQTFISEQNSMAQRKLQQRKFTKAPRVAQSVPLTNRPLLPKSSKQGKRIHAQQFKQSPVNRQAQTSRQQRQPSGGGRFNQRKMNLPSQTRKLSPNGPKLSMAINQRKPSLNARIQQNRRPPSLESMGNPALTRIRHRARMAHSTLLAEGEYLSSRDRVLVNRRHPFDMRSSPNRMLRARPLGPGGRPLTHEEFSELVDA